MAVPSDDSGEVAAAVFVVDNRPTCKAPHAQEFVVGGEVGSAVTTSSSSDHMLPAAPSQEAVIAAGHEGGPVGQVHLVRRFDRCPNSTNVGLDQTTESADSRCTDEMISDDQVTDRARPAVG